MAKLPELNTLWLLSRVEFAERLSRGECGGSYADAVLVISSVISGIASHLWPGERIDNLRFIELWSHYADASLRSNHVSVLLLAQDLAVRGKTKESVAVRALSPAIDVPAGWMDTQTFRGSDVDLPEGDVLSRVALLSKTQVRRHTYSSIFYRCFRSGYVHRYSDDPLVDQNPMSDVQGDVIYTSFADEPRRRVHFSIPWLAEIARSIIRGAETVFDLRPLPEPKPWWVKDG